MTEGGGEGLTEMLDHLEAAPEGEEVSIGEIVEALGRRSFGSLLVIVALLAILPTGAIPGVSALTGALMLLFCLQVLFGQQKMWVPDWLARQTMGRERLETSVERARGIAGRIDRLLGPRLERFVEPPFVNVVALVGALLALTMFPLIPVPFGAFPASIPLIFFGLGLAARDGLVVLTGLVAALVAAYFVLLLLPI
jgi:hypothetical protein